MLLSSTLDAFQVSQFRTAGAKCRSSPYLKASTPDTAEKPSAVPDFSSSTKPIAEADVFADENGSTAEVSSWQENLELLLAPDTSVAERQIMLSDLLNSGEKIQDSVRTALRERKVRYSYCFVSKLGFLCRPGLCSILTYVFSFHLY